MIVHDMVQGRKARARAFIARTMRDLPTRRDLIERVDADPVP